MTKNLMDSFIQIVFLGKSLLTQDWMYKFFNKTSQTAPKNKSYVIYLLK